MTCQNQCAMRNTGLPFPTFIVGDKRPTRFEVIIAVATHICFALTVR